MAASTNSNAALGIGITALVLAFVVAIAMIVTKKIPSENGSYVTAAVLGAMLIVAFVFGILNYVRAQKEESVLHLTPQGSFAKGDLIVPRIFGDERHWALANPASDFGAFVPADSDVLDVQMLHGGKLIAILFMEDVTGKLYLRTCAYNPDTLELGSPTDRTVTSLMGATIDTAVTTSTNILSSMCVLPSGTRVCIVSQDEGATTASAGVLEIGPDPTTTPVLVGSLAVIGVADTNHLRVRALSNGLVALSFSSAAGGNAADHSVQGLVVGESSLTAGAVAVAVGGGTDHHLSQLAAIDGSTGMFVSRAGTIVFTVSPIALVVMVGAFEVVGNTAYTSIAAVPVKLSSAGLMLLSYIGDATSNTLWYRLVDATEASGAVLRGSDVEQIFSEAPAWATTMHSHQWLFSPAEGLVHLMADSGESDVRATAFFGKVADLETSSTVDWQWSDVMTKASVIPAGGSFAAAPVGDGWRYVNIFSSPATLADTMAEIVDFSSPAALVTTAQSGGKNQHLAGNTLQVNDLDVKNMPASGVSVAAGYGGLMHWAVSDNDLIQYSL